jgi:hypothetical protein
MGDVSRCCQERFRTSGSSMYTCRVAMRSASGSFVQTPSGPRKSAMPESVEMPAPVSATIRCDASTNPRARAMSVSVMAIHHFIPPT